MSALLAAGIESFWLVPIAFLTSTLAGAIGLGGGVLLILLMPGFVPAGAILPVHAVVQLASNSSRALFGMKNIDFSMIPWLVVGGVLGVLVGGQIYSSIDLALLPLIIGFLVLVITWVPLPPLVGSGSIALVVLGFYQSGLGMIGGATGPVGAAVLLHRNKQRDWLVVNTAVYMSISHLLRSAAFALMGFVFVNYLALIVAMTGAVVAGSWCGTRLRRFVPEVNFAVWFKILLTLLAVRIVASALITGINH